MDDEATNDSPIGPLGAIFPPCPHSTSPRRREPATRAPRSDAAPFVIARVGLLLLPLLVLGLACGGEARPSASGAAERSTGATAEERPAQASAESEAAPEGPAAEAPEPPSAYAVYLEAGDASAAEALLLRYDEAGDNAHGYPPRGSLGEPSYPRSVAPGGIQGVDAHAVLIALAAEEAVAAALREHLVARGYESVRVALVSAEPTSLRALRLRTTVHSGPPVHAIGALRGSFAHDDVDGGWLGTRSRATEEGMLLFVFEDLAPSMRLLKLEGGGSAEFPYECPIWTVELPSEGAVMEFEATLDTAECIEH